MNSTGKPDAGNLHVRFEEREGSACCMVCRLFATMLERADTPEVGDLNSMGSLSTLLPWSRPHIIGGNGLGLSNWRLMKTAKRGIALCRLFNLREGFSAADDYLRARMAIPPKDGQLKGVAIERDRLEVALRN